MNTYKYDEKIQVTGRGDVYLGKYPSDFNLRVGEIVIIDGAEKIVRGLEYSITGLAPKAGDIIGVLVSEVRK